MRGRPGRQRELHRREHGHADVDGARHELPLDEIAKAKVQVELNRKEG